MITAYFLDHAQIRARSLQIGEPLSDDILWIDILSPSQAEETYLEQALGLEIPSFEEMREIEPSSRLYLDHGAHYMTASLVAGFEKNQPFITPVTFILAGNRLITLRHAEPFAFKQFISQIERFTARYAAGVSTGAELLAALMDAIIDRLADILEHVQERYEEITARVFAEPQRSGETDFDTTLREIGQVQGHIARVRESLVSLSRLLIFVMRPGGALPRSAASVLKTLARDVSSLSDHASYLSSNISFLLSATLGMVNIEQSKIIKIFSVVAVVFLPPTLIASIYGMNFHAMPELSWTWGYPISIALMIFSAILPYWFFKRRGWL